MTRRSSEDRYLHLIAFIAHQCFRLQDNLLDTNAAIRRPASFEYIWGAALPELKRIRPAVYIVNLETAITRRFLAKDINYRMNPENAECLAVAGIDCCALANNHVLDWGREGLFDTVAT